MMGPGNQGIDVRFLAADKSFDAAVAVVTHPAADVKTQGFGTQRVAEADALYAAFDQQPAGNTAVHWPSRVSGAMAARMPCISCSGVGGQPGMVTSTGITLATRPHEA